MKYYGYYQPIESQRNKFYLRTHFSKNFTELTEEQKESIVQDAKKFKEDLIKKGFHRNPNQSYESFVYSRAITYLTDLNIHHIYPTFDEKMAFLIEVTDPELKIAKKYIQSSLLTPYEQKKEQNKDKNKEKQNRKTQDNLFREVEIEFGIGDPNLIKMEIIYFNKFNTQKELLSNIQGNYIEELLEKAIAVRSFNQITDEEYEQASNIAKNLISLQPDIKNPNTIAFNLLKQNKLIGGNGTLKQAILIFILIYDPELTMLKIFLDESTQTKIIQRAKEELGFYNKNLIRLEKEYHERFIPEKEISVWQLKKATMLN